MRVTAEMLLAYLNKMKHQFPLGSRWIHKEKKNLYRITGYALDVDSQEPRVLYQDVTSRKLTFARHPVFLSERFEKKD
jgi:hypothetical protein